MKSKMNLPRLAGVVAVAFVAVLTFASTSYAQLLPELIQVATPKITFDSGGSATYNSTTDNLSILATTTGVQFDPSMLPCPFLLTPGTTSIGVQVDGAGVFAGGVPGDDLVIMGGVVNLPPFLIPQCNPLNIALGGVLMRGEVLEFGHRNDPDEFVFRVALTGGAFFDNGMMEAAVKVSSQNSGFAGTFANNFTGGAAGDAGVMIALLPLCTGTIGDFVWNDLNRDGIQNEGPAYGISAALSLSVLTATDPTTGTEIWSPVTPGGETNSTDATSPFPGQYSFPNLCAGTYKVEVTTPTGYTASATQRGDNQGQDSNPNPSTVVLPTNTSVIDTIDFGFYETPNGPYKTFTQAGWGSKPKGTNPGALLRDNFSFVYPSLDPLVIGDDTAACAAGTGPYRINLTSPLAVREFLPQGGRPVALRMCATDPTSRISRLAGEVLALTLNVDFSNAGVTQPGLGSLIVAKSWLVGRTVSDVLAIGNCMLSSQDSTSCGAAGVTLSRLNNVIRKINKNFAGGSRHKRYLLDPTQPLAVHADDVEDADDHDEDDD